MALASTRHWRLLIATIAALAAGAVLLPLWVPRPDFQENRVLAARPAWPGRIEDIPAFREAADAYVTDRFPARSYLIGLLNRARMLAGVSGSPRVIVGRDGWLFYDDDTHMGAVRNDPPMEAAQVRSWLQYLAGRTEAAHTRGARYLIIAPPMKEAIYPGRAPKWLGAPRPDRPAMTLPRLARAAQAGEALYLYPQVAQDTRSGVRTFSRHDTHWTGHGAYAGYVGLMRRLRAMGLAEAPLPLSAFVPTPLEGRQRPRDLARMLGVASFVRLDYSHFAHPTAEARIRTTYLSASHDWTAPQVVDTGQIGKPILLLTRDSFSIELLPFLYPHFSRIVLAHNQDGFWRPDLIDRFKPDIVILEVLESGLRLAAGDGPPPSREAAARIEHALGGQARAAGPSIVSTMPALVADPGLSRTLDTAKPTSNCNFEVATLTAGPGGNAIARFSGWVSELAPSITSGVGVVRLRGPEADLVAPIRVDLSRPDVAAFFKIPSGEHSGFLGVFVARGLPPGVYTETIYRRAPSGWIACVGGKALTAPERTLSGQ